MIVIGRALAEDHDVHLPADLGQIHQIHQMISILDGHIVKLQDHVARHESGPPAGEFGVIRVNRAPIRRGSPSSEAIVAVALIPLHSQEGTRHGPAADQLAADQHERVDGNRESDALASARVAGDGRVDANDFAPEIDQRATAIAGINRCVGL